MTDINLNDLLRGYRSNPFEERDFMTPHSGVITFLVKEGQVVNGPGGKWSHKPGTALYMLERERNIRKVTATCGGEVAKIMYELEGGFVEAGVRVLSVRHKLAKDEIIDRILTQVLYIFCAPERARYFLAPEIASKLEKQPQASLFVRPGDEVIIMSLMKRDTIINYDGASGVIYKTYFEPGNLVEQEAPLLGICPPNKLPYVQKVIHRINNEWED
ncbi:MAG: hypothetical protein M0022_07835 [Desulfobacteraceae bacterium]|nr:hypothetical protein [Desulfobacteraceae bacterium]